MAINTYPGINISSLWRVQPYLLVRQRKTSENQLFIHENTKSSQLDKISPHIHFPRRKNRNPGCTMHLIPVHMVMALLATTLSTAFPVQSMNPQFSLSARAASQTVSCAGSSACNIALSSTLSWACNRAHTKIDPTATYMTGYVYRYLLTIE